MAQSNLIFCCLALIFTVVDMVYFSLLEQQLFATLLCLYIIKIFTVPNGYNSSKNRLTTTWWPLLFGMLLLALESFYFNGTCIATLLYLIPATLIGVQLRQVLHGSTLQYHVLLVACLLAHSFMIDYTALPAGTWLVYTVTKILVNLLVMVIFLTLLAPKRSGRY